MSEELRQRVARQIEEAWADAQYPGDDNLTRCSWNCVECTKLALEFSGKHWRDLKDAAFLSKYYVALSLFTPEAFHFYLPAFMRTILNGHQDTGMIPESLHFHLTPPDSNDEQSSDWLDRFGYTLREYFLGRVSNFNQEQAASIVAYLRLYADKYPDDARFYKLDTAIAFWETYP